MKIAVFADIHGSVAGMERVLEICSLEKPDKVVICGDLFGGWVSLSNELVNLVSKIDAVTYLIRGNNDRESDIALLPYGMEDNAVMYHFGRTLFFTHGDRYDKWRVPPLLKQDDAFIYGHTHMGLLQKYNGLYIANVGSVSRPRDGQSCYLLIEELGFTLKKLDGSAINTLLW